MKKQIKDAYVALKTEEGRLLSDLGRVQGLIHAHDKFNGNAEPVGGARRGRPPGSKNVKSKKPDAPRPVKPAPTVMEPQSSVVGEI